MKHTEPPLNVLDAKHLAMTRGGYNGYAALPPGAQVRTGTPFVLRGVEYITTDGGGAKAVGTGRPIHPGLLGG